MTKKISAREQFILGEILNYNEQNGDDHLRPEDIALDVGEFHEISDAMFRFAAMGLGVADSNGLDCCGFTVEFERARKAYDDWKAPAPAKAGAAATVANVTEALTKTCYTKDKAAREYARLTALAAEKGWSKRSLAAYRAHLSRRVGNTEAVRVEP